VALNVRHTITSEYRSAICLVIEPESVRAGAFELLAEPLSGPRRRSLRNASALPVANCGGNTAPT
jgi:hypothetical protein